MTLHSIREALQEWLAALPCLPTNISWENSQECELCPPFVRPFLLPGINERLDCQRVRLTGTFQVDIHMPTGLDKTTATSHGPYPGSDAMDCLLCAALWGDEPKIGTPPSATTVHLFDRAGNPARARGGVLRDGHYIVGVDIPYQLIACDC